MGGEGPIPWASLDRWARRQGLGQQAFDELVTFIRVLDRLWLDHRAKPQPKDEPETPDRGRKRGG